MLFSPTVLTIAGVIGAVPSLGCIDEAVVQGIGLIT